MKLLRTDQGVVLDVYVKPDSRDFKLEIEDDQLVAYCRQAPVKGKANKELVKELARLFRKRATVIAGSTSKQKKILILDISLEAADEVLSRCTHV
jgi:uncharacterized protein (TIGR00251 family)